MFGPSNPARWSGLASMLSIHCTVNNRRQYGFGGCSITVSDVTDTETTRRAVRLLLSLAPRLFAVLGSISEKHRRLNGIKMFRATQLVLRGKNRAEPALSSLVNYYSTASSSQRLSGKVAVITGAASGIGKATAAEFVRNGAKVILADVQDDLGCSVAAELGPDAVYTRCDVTDEAQVAAAVDLAVARHGRLDIVFNNAGVSGNLTPTPLGSLDLADFDRVAAVNTRAVLAGVKHAARVMVPRRSGSIICTASTAGVIGAVSPHPYSISKAAVIGLVRAVAGEMARSGVRVNAIAPHCIPTPVMMRAMGEWYPGTSVEEHKRMVEREMNEMDGVVLEVEDVARAATYLASDEAKYVNGHILVVDGGFTVTKAPNMPAPTR